MDKVEVTILKTLFYADVFDFPLKANEICRFLVTERKISQTLINETLSEMRKKGQIGERKGFFFLKGRDKIVNLRKDREKWSKEKLKIAKKASQSLKIIPHVKMVAATGALAMKNAKREDDIDLLIVPKKGRIWTTRFFATILVEVFFKRRRPQDKDVADKICLNMFLVEEHLALPKNERDLFTAHEVTQLKVLWDKDNTYQKFLWANRWVGKYLPNAPSNVKCQMSNVKTTTQIANLFLSFFILICHFPFSIFNFKLIEEILKRFQLYYMRKRRTTEVVSDDVIRFHPKDARVWVLREYKRRLKSYDMI